MKTVLGLWTLGSKWNIRKIRGNETEFTTRCDDLHDEKLTGRGKLVPSLALTKSDCARSGTTGRGDGGSVGHVERSAAATRQWGGSVGHVGGVVGAAGGHVDECLRAARERVGRFGRLGSIRGTSDGSRGGGCSDFFVRIERVAAKEIVRLLDKVFC